MARTLSAKKRLALIAEVIEAVDDRAMAADGPVTPTLQEMTQEEMSRIYRLARCTNLFRVTLKEPPENKPMNNKPFPNGVTGSADDVEAEAPFDFPPPTEGEQMSARKHEGVYKKFIVWRSDGRHRRGEKHEQCDYFVLDVTHDPFAAPALRAYADACELNGYALLAGDLRAKAFQNENMAR